MSNTKKRGGRPKFVPPGMQRDQPVAPKPDNGKTTYSSWTYNRTLMASSYVRDRDVDAETPQEALDLVAKRLRSFVDIYIVPENYGTSQTHYPTDHNVLARGPGLA